MKHDKNQARNFMNAALSYSEFGLIPDAKDHIDRNVCRAIELVFTRKIFTDEKRFDARQLFEDEIYNPEVKSGSSLERYSQVMEGLEQNGMFTRVAIKELSTLPDRVPADYTLYKMRSETQDFTKMMERIVQRKRGEDVNPTFEGEVIKCAIVFVARTDKYLEKGLAPYLTFINRSIEDGIRTFYVCAIGDRNVSITQEIIDAYDASERVFSVPSEPFSLRNGQKACCIILHATDA